MSLGLALSFELVSAQSAIVFWTSVSVAPFVALHLFSYRKHVPGAMDDLAGIAVITEAGRDLASQPLDNTEIWLVACAAEECGLRGSKRFLSKFSWVLHHPNMGYQY